MAAMIEHEVGDNVFVRDSQHAIPVPAEIIEVGWEGNQSYLKVKPNAGPPEYTFNFKAVPQKSNMSVIFADKHKSTNALITDYNTVLVSMRMVPKRR